jgi:hypothetical protein
VYEGIISTTGNTPELFDLHLQASSNRIAQEENCWGHIVQEELNVIGIQFMGGLSYSIECLLN